MDPTKITLYVTAAVTVASILANFVPPYTVVGRALHWVALNIRIAPPVVDAPTTCTPPAPPPTT